MDFYDYVSLVAHVEEKEETATGRSNRDGLIVDCRPVLEDLSIVQRQSRVLCISRPYPSCSYCPHSSFDLLFKVNKEARFDLVACPRWSNPMGRITGNSPDGYVSVEKSTCAAAPFEFCPSCPSQKNVATTGADKTVDGWYGRWNRIRKEELEDDDG